MKCTRRMSHVCSRARVHVPLGGGPRGRRSGHGVVKRGLEGVHVQGLLLRYAWRCVGVDCRRRVAVLVARRTGREQRRRGIHGLLVRRAGARTEHARARGMPRHGPGLDKHGPGVGARCANGQASNARGRRWQGRTSGAVVASAATPMPATCTATVVDVRRSRRRGWGRGRWLSRATPGDERMHAL